jgi:NAD+ kinase
MQASFAKIGLVGRREQRGLPEVLSQLLDLLSARGLEVMLEEELDGVVSGHNLPLASCDAIGEAVDLVIVVGGDGSLLSAARTLAKYDTPVIGVNRGRLGFLTDITPDELTQQLDQVIGSADALNDVVVNSGTSAQMIEFELSIDNTFVYRQRADGLIVSTPTGSTAYSLSGGGPIMHPALNAMVLVPMFPHALSSRPIVVDGDALVRLDILERNRIHPPVTCDGQVIMTARPGDSVHIRKKPHKLTLLHPIGHSFYASCRDKLRWSNALVN